jgi:hypothetical protein
MMTLRQNLLNKDVRLLRKSLKKLLMKYIKPELKKVQAIGSEKVLHLESELLRHSLKI